MHFKSIFRLRLENQNIIKSDIFQIDGVCGERHRGEGSTVIKINIGNYEREQKFYIFSRLHEDLLLGIDFLNNSGAKIDIQNQTIPFQGGHTKIQSIQTMSHIGLAKLASDIVIPPWTEVVVPDFATDMINSSHVLLEQTKKLSSKFRITGGRCMVNVEKGKLL